MSVFTKNSFSSPSSLLLCAVATACVLQVALAMPLAQNPFHFTMHSSLSGKFIRMHQNKSVDGNGEPSNPEAQWDMRMIGSGYGFENVAHPGNYLMVALLGNETVLLSHSIRPLPSQSFVEGLLKEAEMSGSGSLVEEPTMAASTEEEPAEFAVLFNWLFETLEIQFTLTGRFSAVADNRDCFLAIDRFGQPESNLCAVPEERTTTHITLLPYFF